MRVAAPVRIGRSCARAGFADGAAPVQEVTCEGDETLCGSAALCLDPRPGGSQDVADPARPAAEAARPSSAESVLQRARRPSPRTGPGTSTRRRSPTGPPTTSSSGATRCGTSPGAVPRQPLPLAADLGPEPVHHRRPLDLPGRPPDHPRRSRWSPTGPARRVASGEPTEEGMPGPEPPAASGDVLYPRHRGDGPAVRPVRGRRARGREPAS